MRYLLRGQVVEFEARSDVLNLGLIRDPRTGNERVFIERLTALELLCRSILQHRGHRTLLRADDPLNRLIGLHCTCEQPAYEIQMSLSLVLLASQEVRDVIRELGPVPVPRYVRSKKERQGATRAERRARDLLHQMLTQEQRWCLRASGSFRVRGQDGRTYLVREGQTVQLLEGDVPIMSYCIHPREPLPASDVMLAQKLLLETNIQQFLENSNATPLTRAG